MLVLKFNFIHGAEPLYIALADGENLQDRLGEFTPGKDEVHAGYTNVDTGTPVDTIIVAFNTKFVASIEVIDQKTPQEIKHQNEITQAELIEKFRTQR